MGRLESIFGCIFLIKETVSFSFEFRLFKIISDEKEYLEKNVIITLRYIYFVLFIILHFYFNKRGMK